ncbi:MAG: dihydrodipicolinate synthase family protein [Anaerolineales bacterium]|nr:dihydrodipicolinate synthase family protein [Anaerolineales bacterium]
MSKKSVQLSGIVPPLITAFDKHGNVDEKAQREIVSYLKQYVQGFYVCGSYGSGPLMTVEQRKQVAEIVIDEVSGDIPVVIHVGTTSTEASMELAKHAEQAGAHAVASVPPYYFSHSEREVKYHFQNLIDSVNLPVMVYNNPKTTGFSVTPQFLNELAEIGLKGVKDSSFSIITFFDYLRKVKAEDFAFIVGTEAFIFSTVSMGAEASIAGLGNAIPEPVVELFQATKAGDVAKAKQLHFKVLALRDIVQYAPTLTTVQLILQLRGINSGLPKMPFRPIEGELRDRVIAALKPYNVI